MAESNDQSARSFRLTATILVVAGLVTLAAQLPLPGVSGLRSTYKALWPQGWSFFSGAPSSEVTTAYQIVPDGRLTQLTLRQAEGKNLWGLRRGVYSQLAETQVLRDRVPAAKWSPCGGSAAGCDQTIRSSAPFQMPNASRHPTLCGSIVLVTTPPHDDVAATDPATFGAATRVTVLELTC